MADSKFFIFLGLWCLRNFSFLFYHNFGAKKFADFWKLAGRRPEQENWLAAEYM